MSKRFKTKYTGVFYRKAKRIGVLGVEKVYYVVYKKNGQWFEEKAGRRFCDDMTPARAAKIRSELIEGIRLPRKKQKEQEKQGAQRDKWTIDRIWKAYKKRRKKNKALETDEGRFDRYLKPFFGDKEPKEILPSDVERLTSRLLKKRSPQTTAHVLNLLTWIVNYAVDQNLCNPLPFKIRKPRIHNLKTECLSSEQLKRLLDAIEADSNIQAKNLMKMALFTGMRRGELFRLQWEDIDFQSGTVLIRNFKGGPDQRIPLNEPAKQVLESHQKTTSPYVFPGRKGRQRVDINHQINRIKRRAGLPDDFRPLHGLRHTYACMIASSGKVNTQTLQTLLAHSDPRMTQRYLRLQDNTLKQASELAGHVIGKMINADDDEKEPSHKDRQRALPDE